MLQLRNTEFNSVSHCWTSCSTKSSGFTVKFCNAWRKPNTKTIITQSFVSSCPTHIGRILVNSPFYSSWKVTTLFTWNRGEGWVRTVRKVQIIDMLISIFLMIIISTSLTVPTQPSPRFHVEGWLPFRNHEMDYWSHQVKHGPGYTKGFQLADVMTITYRKHCKYSQCNVNIFSCSCRFLPTAEETEMYRNYKEDASTLLPPDQFMKKVLNFVYFTDVYRSCCSNSCSRMYSFTRWNCNGIWAHSLTSCRKLI